MNSRQLAALWTGTLLAAAQVLYPPHVMMPNLVDVMKSQFGAPDAQPPQLTRYAFLFAPPAGSAGIDWERLVVPLLLVGLLTVTAVLSLRAPRPGSAIGAGG